MLFFSSASAGKTEDNRREYNFNFKHTRLRDKPTALLVLI
jgi:hypothetical protein